MRAYLDRRVSDPNEVVSRQGFDRSTEPILLVHDRHLRVAGSSRVSIDVRGEDGTLW